MIGFIDTLQGKVGILSVKMKKQQQNGKNNLHVCHKVIYKKMTG